MATIAFGGAAGGEHFELAGGFVLGGRFLPELAAGIGLAVEGLSDGGWAADVAEEQDFDLEVATVIGDAEHVSDADFTGGFSGLIVGLNASEFAGAGGEGAGFEKSGSPDVFVDADGGHGDFVILSSRLNQASKTKPIKRQPCCWSHVEEIPQPAKGADFRMTEQ
jgi:hypothetical protein